jgi:hypothetical protein
MFTWPTHVLPTSVNYSTIWIHGFFYTFTPLSTVLCSSVNTILCRIVHMVLTALSDVALTLTPVLVDHLSMDFI